MPLCDDDDDQNLTLLRAGSEWPMAKELHRGVRDGIEIFLSRRLYSIIHVYP